MNASGSFIPISGNHSRQRSPAIAGLGKDAKLFNSTATASLHTGGINISDKKLENLGGSFNLSMNMVPCSQIPTPSSCGDETKKSVASCQAVVKEEHDEDDEEVKMSNKPSQMNEIHLNLMNMSETAASTCLLDQSTKVVD